MRKRLIADLSSSTLNQRHFVQKTVENYPDDWKVIHETLQNALDAIQRSGKEQGQVTIRMDLDNEEVTIKDNGVGFPFNLDLLGFGGSDKRTIDWRIGGDIGVGLKVVIASSNNFVLKAVFRDAATGKLQEWACKIPAAFQYLNEIVEDIDVDYDEPAEISEGETYTELSYSFSTNERYVTNLIQDIYHHYFVEFEEPLIRDVLALSPLDKFKLALEHYFRTTGYAANVNNLLGVESTAPCTVDVHISCRGEALNQIGEEGLRQIFSNSPTISIRFKNEFWEVEEVVQRTRAGSRKPTVLRVDLPDGGDIGDHTVHYMYIKKFTNPSEYAKLLTNTKMPPGRRPQLSRYSTLFDRMLGVYLVIGSRDVLRKYLVGYSSMRRALQPVAASGIPSIHVVHAPSDVGGLGYLNNIYMIVNLKQRLTYGKQQIKNPWLLGEVNAFLRDAFRTTLRNAAKCIAGRVPEPPPLAGPTRDIVSRADLNVPTLSIRKTPEEEMEVVALFYELIGRDYLTEYETWRLASREMYDGYMTIEFPNIERVEPASDRDLDTMEFKAKFSRLIDDFDHGRKIFDSSLRLIVVWENDFNREYPRGHRRFEVVNIKDTIMIDHRLSYVTQCLHDRDTGVTAQILELKRVIEDIRSQAES